MFYLTIHSPRQVARLPYQSKTEAEQKAAEIKTSGYPVSIETDEQHERETAPMIKPQPKSQPFEGWDI